MSKRAVLLLAHGTPQQVSEIPEYLSKVTGGRPLPQAAVEEIQHRYGLIGHSPLTEWTLQQASQLNGLLDLPVYAGMRNWHPYIADTLNTMRADGVDEAAVLCLAPQNSRTSTGLYLRAVQKAAEGLRFDFTEGWATHPSLIEAFAQRLQAAQQSLSELGTPNTAVLFTAHSVPERTVQAQTAEDGTVTPPDPYSTEAQRTAALVAERLNLPDWRFAFQSQGMSGGPWIGPRVEDTLDALRQQGHTSVILQPIGFLCDHVEILYDVDIAFREHAAKVGITLTRPESLNGSALLTEALADLSRQAFARLEAGILPA